MPILVPHYFQRPQTVQHSYEVGMRTVIKIIVGERRVEHAIATGIYHAIQFLFGMHVYSVQFVLSYDI